YRGCIEAATRHAQAAVEARSAAALVLAVEGQTDALETLGREAGAPIVTDEVAALRAAARAAGGAFAPSGAGGGDIAIFVGRAPSLPSFRAQAAARGLSHVSDIAVGASGAGRIDGG